MAERFAIYFAPGADTPLWTFGTSWLGRDPERGVDVARAAVPGFTRDELDDLTAPPRRYGFHATLKPPFALPPEHTRDALTDRLGSFAAQRTAFDAPPLKLDTLNGFLALVPGSPSAELSALAADCVRTFDAFRRPPGDAELARRRRHDLTPQQEDNLLRWGYPYVLDAFRFHMTLTKRLDAETRARLLPALADLTSAVGATPLRVDGLALFHEPAPGEDFRLIERFGFAA